MFDRMTRAMSSSCTVIPYMLGPATLALGCSTVATTFSWKLNVILRMTCNCLGISKVAG